MYKKIKIHLHRKNILILFVFALFIYMGFTTIGVIARNYKLQEEIDDLRSKNQLLALQNQELEYQIIYFQTDEFLDREARDKLGLKGRNEKVVIFPDQIPRPERPKQEAISSTERAKTVKEKTKANFDQWMYFLFRKDPIS
jgi:cell division protein FtsB